MPCRIVATNHWLQVRPGGVKSPIDSSYSSGDESDQDTIELMIEKAKRDPAQMKALASPFFSPYRYTNSAPQALERDNNKCLFTGRMDMDIFAEALERGQVDFDGPTPGYTQATHILPFPLSRKSRDIGADVSDDFLGYEYGSYAQ
jgi:hypothetical protein